MLLKIKVNLILLHSLFKALIFVLIFFLIFSNKKFKQIQITF